MFFTEEQIRFLIDEMRYDTVVEPTKDFRFRIQRLERTGWTTDRNRSQIQAVLSIMLEAKTMPKKGVPV